MAAIIWSDVTAHAAQLSVVSSGAQADILAYVNEVLDVSVLGGEASVRAKLARVYLAAHFGELERRRGAAGPLASESVGGMSRSYAAMASSENLDSTGYGQAYRSIVRVSPARWPMVL